MARAYKIIFGRELSMDVYEWLEYKYWKSKEKEKRGSEVKIK